MGPSAASSPPCHSCCSNNAEPHPSVTTFELGDPALVFPSTSSCGSPFLPTLKESQLWGHGISTGFVAVGSRIQAFLTVAVCPSSVVGSDPAGVKGGPKLLLCPHPWKVCALASMLLCLRQLSMETEIFRVFWPITG